MPQKKPRLQTPPAPTAREEIAVRSARATAALATYTRLHGADEVEFLVTDLILDLYHFAIDKGLDPDRLSERVQRHAKEEQAEVEETPKGARCRYCRKRMLEAEGCQWAKRRGVTFPDQTTLPAVPYDDADRPGRRCHDCGALGGHCHHPGCDDERCPKCEGQLISCGCLDTEEEKREFEAKRKEWEAKQAASH